MFSDRDIAIRILALEECRPEDDPRSCLAHYEERFWKWKTEDHSGDCTKQPWTCSRCTYDETMKRVAAARFLFNLES